MESANLDLEENKEIASKFEIPHRRYLLKYFVF